MIYTITFNPAVDLVVQAPDVMLGKLNRSSGEEYVAGGKGINMSVVLQRLGVENTAIACLGGIVNMPMFIVAWFIESLVGAGLLTVLAGKKK